MFFAFPKSKTALEKAAALSHDELHVFNMHVTAALLRPDSHVRPIDFIRTVQNDVFYEFLTLEFSVGIIILVFHPNGRIGITDFYVTAPLIPALNQRGLTL
jgi:hypothetical protein